MAEQSRRGEVIADAELVANDVQADDVHAELVADDVPEGGLMPELASLRARVSTATQNVSTLMT